MIKDFINGTLGGFTRHELHCHPQSGHWPGNRSLPMGTEGRCSPRRASRAKPLSASGGSPPRSSACNSSSSSKNLLEAEVEELAREVVLEHGKTLAEARASVKRGIQMIEYRHGHAHFQKGEFLEDIARGIDCTRFASPWECSQELLLQLPGHGALLVLAIRNCLRQYLRAQARAGCHSLRGASSRLIEKSAYRRGDEPR